MQTSSYGKLFLLRNMNTLTSIDTSGHASRSVELCIPDLVDMKLPPEFEFDFEFEFLLLALQGPAILPSLDSPRCNSFFIPQNSPLKDYKLQIDLSIAIKKSKINS